MLIIKYTFFFLVLTRAGSGVILGLARYDSFSFGAILNAVTLLLAVAVLVKRRRPSVLLSRADLAAIPHDRLLFTDLHPDLFSGARLFLSTLTFPAMFICAFVLVESHADMIAFFKFAIYSSILPAIYAMFQLATNGPGFRVASTFGHPNIFAFYIVAMLVAILYLNTAPRTRDQFGLAMVFAALFYGPLRDSCSPPRHAVPGSRRHLSWLLTASA